MTLHRDIGESPAPARLSRVIPAMALGLLSLAAVSSWKTEFRIHAYHINDQDSPVIASDGTGRFLAVWVSERQDGQLAGIFARLFNAFGLAQGPEFQVNLHWENIQERPYVTAAPNGRHLVLWYDFDRENISARLFDGNASPLTDEFAVTEPDFGFKGGQAAAMDVLGGFVVVWHHDDQDLGLTHVFARVFDRYGTPFGSRFQVSREAPGDQMNPSVAVHPGGDITVVWTRYAAAGIRADVVGRRFARTGIPLGQEFIVNSSSSGRHEAARLALAPNGAFLVCWHAFEYSESAYDILARRFSPTSVPQGEEFTVNTVRSGWQNYPSIDAGETGYLLTWQSSDRTGSGSGIVATVLDGNGAPLLEEFQVNSSAGGRRQKPKGVFLSENRVVFVWEEFLDGASDWDVTAVIQDIVLKKPESPRLSRIGKRPPIRRP